MRQGALRQEAFEELEAYVLGTMEEGQRITFEQKLASDPELREELELERENILAVEMAGVERTLKDLRAAHGTGSTEGGSRWAPLLKYAAMLALLLGAGIWWAVRPSAQERVFAQYYHPDPGLPVPMIVVKDPEFQQIALTDAPAVFGWGEWHAVDTGIGMTTLLGGLEMLQADGYLVGADLTPLSMLLFGGMTEAGMQLARDGSDDEIERFVATICQVILAMSPGRDA